MSGKLTCGGAACPIVAASVLMLCVGVNGQVLPTTEPDNQPTTRAKPAGGKSVRLGDRSVRPLPQGQTKALQALVIDVQGRAQWRPSTKAPWQSAKVDDLLDPGAQIRTGLRSSMTIRAGRNATILIGRSSRVDLPVLLQDGASLRTRATVRRGRADFKVDVVGLTNDFEVLTPTTTLAVRGTGFAVKWGGLEGVEIEALASNAIRAIEVRYLLARLSYYLSGQGVTRENKPDPVEAALDKTVSLPVSSASSKGEDFADLGSERRVDYGRLGFATTIALVSSFSSDEPLSEDMLLAMAICDSLDAVFASYFDLLDQQLGVNKSQFTQFFEMVEGLRTFCEGLDEFEGNPMQYIQDQITAFCQSYGTPSFQHQHPFRDEVQHCIDLFQGLLDDLPGGVPQ